MKFLSSIVAALLMLAACADGAEKKGDKKAATNAPSFSVQCSKAWIKGITDKPSVTYKPGEDIKFTLSLMGVTNAIPAGKYFYQWKRKGSDGAEEEGKVELTKTPFDYTTKLENAGFVRFSAQIVTEDGKPFMKQVGGKPEPLVFEGGAGVAIEELPVRAETKPRDFDAWLKELRRKVSSVPFKNIDRTPVETPELKGLQVFSVSIPCLGEHPLTGFLALPDAAAKGEKMACRVVFTGHGHDEAQPLPRPWDVSSDYVSLVMGYDSSSEAQAGETYYPDLCARMIRAFQYLKTIPEWNGRTLCGYGAGANSQLAVISGGLGEGVTKVTCYHVRAPQHEKYDPLFFARRIPKTCLVEVLRVALGDDWYGCADAALLWNVLTCEKKMLWIQGAHGWDDQPWFNGRDVQWEKLTPVTFHDMSAEHSKPTGSTNIGFKDVDLALRDKIVVEAIIDPANLKDVNQTILADMKQYCDKDKVPFTLYVTIPEKKVRDKVWTEFVKIMAGTGDVPYPVYLNAGMDLPKPEKLPWFNVVDIEGVLRYSGPDLNKANEARAAAVRRVPKADPVFAFAPVKLFKAELEKPTKVKRTGLKLYKYIEGELRKCQKSNPARAAEAEHLLVGMRQARDARIRDIALESNDRPGRAMTWLAEFLQEWPDQVADPRVMRLQTSFGKNPEVEKIAKLEKELVHLREWQPTKNMEIKKRDAAVAMFRRKLEKYANSKDTSLQGEALLIQTEFDNPPPAPDAEN